MSSHGSTLLRVAYGAAATQFQDRRRSYALCVTEAFLDDDLEQAEYWSERFVDATINAQRCWKRYDRWASNTPPRRGTVPTPTD